MIHFKLVNLFYMNSAAIQEDLWFRPYYNSKDYIIIIIISSPPVESSWCLFLTISNFLKVCFGSKYTENFAIYETTTRDAMFVFKKLSPTHWNMQRTTETQ